MKLFCIPAFLGAAFCSVAMAASPADGIRVVVNSSIITDYQVVSGVESVLQQLREQYATSPELFQQKASEVLANQTEVLVDRQLILHDFKTAGYVFPETFLDDAVRDYIRENFRDRVEATKTLQARGMTYEKLRQQIREKNIIEFLQRKNVSAEIIISPHKIETYYKENADKFKLDEQVKLRVIELGPTAASTAEARKQLAQDILTELREGADFAQMAQLHSTSASGKAGGYLKQDGWTARTDLRKELVDAAFALQPKQLSPVIETPEANYLLLIEDRRTAHVQPLSDVRDEIEQTLRLREQDRLQKRYLEKLKRKTFVSYY